MWLASVATIGLLAAAIWRRWISFYGAYWKIKFMPTIPQSVDDFQQDICVEIAQIDKETVDKVLQNEDFRIAHCQPRPTCGWNTFSSLIGRTTISNKPKFVVFFSILLTDQNRTNRLPTHYFDEYVKKKITYKNKWNNFIRFFLCNPLRLSFCM